MERERDLNVISDNLRLIGARRDDLRTVLSGQYREALTVYKDFADKTEFSTPTEEAVWLFQRITGEESPCSVEFASFCIEFAEFFPNRISMELLLGQDDADQPDEAGNTSYMKNAYADRAYSRFSEIIPEMKATYATSYASACEEVYNGRSEYAILPVYHSKDGSLITFRRMLSKYELKITAECPCELEDGEVFLFALAQKSLPLIPRDCIDISVVLPEELTTARFLQICELFGMGLRFINSVPLEYAGDSLSKNEINISFHCKDADLMSFALFLDASHTRYDIEGIYNILN